ncbi:MAG: polysaccharide deacetylase family protein [Treponema sp.]|nr:polysaccharide deacetylase family protein [Treponema sp.]
MRHKFAPLLLLILLCSCRTINHNHAELNIPPSAVYFSFDDGPNANGDTTARLLDVLKKYQIKAVFCLLGENAEQFPELVKRMYDEGHCIVNHGYSDKWVVRMKPNQFRDNLARGTAAISAALGFEVNPKLYRPHGGFYRSAQEKIMLDEGYKVVPATVRVYDTVAAETHRRKVVNEIIKKIEKQGGGIILLHDARDSHVLTEAQLAKNPRGVFDRSWVPDAVEEIILILVDRGFTVNSPDILIASGS